MRVQRVLPLVVGALLVATPVLAGLKPVTVSPGDPSKLVLIESRCPTFSWGQVDGAQGYELVAYRLGEEGEEAIPVLRQSLSGAVGSWTPSLGRCLKRAGRYAWSVRAVGSEEASDWSAPSLFQVAAGPSQAEFEQALAVVQSYLDTGQEVVPSSGTVTQAEAELESEAETSESRPATRTVGTTQMSVDGGVVAESFTGDGSTLTSLDPANLAAGTAGIDISGTAATASDLVGGACVSESELDFDPATQSELVSHAGLAQAHHTIPTSLPPSGRAGRALAGFYPNPRLAQWSIDTDELKGLQGVLVECNGECDDERLVDICPHPTRYPRAVVCNNVRDGYGTPVRCSDRSDGECATLPGMLSVHQTLGLYCDDGGGWDAIVFCLE